jgi:hypothetical protein
MLTFIYIKYLCIYYQKFRPSVRYFDTTIRNDCLCLIDKALPSDRAYVVFNPAITANTVQYGRTFIASGPFLPWAISYSTA